MYKKIVKDMFVTFSTTVLMALFGFVSSILVARLLGPEKQGAAKIIIILPTMMLTFMNFGIDVAVLYFSAREKFFRSMNRLMGRITLFFILIVAVVGPAVIFFGRGYFVNIPLAYLFSALPLVPLNFYQTTQTAIIRAENRYMKYNLINTVKQTSYFVIVMLVIFYKNLWVVIAANYAMVLAGIVMCKAGVRHEDAEGAGRPHLKDILKFGLKSYISNTVNYLNYRFDDIYLKPFVSLSSLGIYTVAQTLSEQIWMIPNSVSIVLLPRLAAMEEEEKKNVSLRACRYVATVMFLISLLAVALAGIIFPLLYSKNYSDSVLPFRILMIGTFLMSYGKILMNAIAGYGRPGRNISANVAGSLSNVVLNILLIPKYGILGAAVSGMISYSILSVVTVMVFIRINSTKVRILDMLFMNVQDYKAVYALVRKRLTKRKAG